MKQYRWLLVVLVLWAVCNAPRIVQPFKAGHDSYISSHYGAFALNHLKLGLGVTHGANILAVNYSGKPTVYYSFSPLVSWLVAIPLALGLPFQPAVHTVSFLFFLWFLAAFWFFVRNVWGRPVANVAVAVLAILPVTLRYALITGDGMALAPLFSFLALYTLPRPHLAGWSARMIMCGLLASLLSWYSLVLILPCMWLEWRRGNRGPAVAVAASVAGVSVLLPVAAVLVTGTSVAASVAHLQQRLGFDQYAPGVRTLSHLDLLHRFLIWSFHPHAFFGTLAALLTAGVLAWALFARVTRRMAVRGDGWLLALAAYGTPFTLLLPNMATFHDGFLGLFAPLVAISCALAAASANDHLGNAKRSRVLRPAVSVLLLMAIFATATWPAREQLLPSPIDYQLRDLATALGRAAQGDTAILGSVAVMGRLTDEQLDLARRDDPWPSPYVTCLTSKTAYVCRDAVELTALLRQLPPGRPVVIVERDRDLEPLPSGAARQEIGPFTVATWRTPAQPVAIPAGVKP